MKEKIESKKSLKEHFAPPIWGVLGKAGANLLKEDLLRSEILSNYWYVRTHILPKIANMTGHRCPQK